MTDHHDIIAAFVDNEPVGAEDLATALAASEGRDYLIDLLVLRGFVGDGHGVGLQVAGRRAHAAGGPQAAAQLKRRGLWLTAAAALLAVGVAAGFVAGRLSPVGSQSDARETTNVGRVPVATTVAAPAPTHVIRMERGVDWNERSGGN